MYKYKTYKCGELSLKDIGKRVKISGWILKKRHHNKICFVELRDDSGTVQLVIIKKKTKNLFSILTKINNESVIEVLGVIKKKIDKKNKYNIELLVKNCRVYTKASILPIIIYSKDNINEKIRLKNRFLDLRRKDIRNNIKSRSNIIRFIRNKMWALGFEELQTPILASQSPEGARDFLIPSRKIKNNFYALPQAPQQFKQLYMMSGFDKYFQIAPCFRDEESRLDRTTGEFYQLDIEMSFIKQKDIIKISEKIVNDIFNYFLKRKNIKVMFLIKTYKDSILKYCSDKPDLRSPINADKIDKIVRKNNIYISRKIRRNNYTLKVVAVKVLNKCICIRIINFYKNKLKSRNIFFINIGKENIRTSLFGILNIYILKRIIKITKGNNYCFFIYEKEEVSKKNVQEVIKKLNMELNLINDNEIAISWIINSPIYKWSHKEKKTKFFHNPFSMIKKKEFLSTLKEKLLTEAYQYDIIYNGKEIASGAIRNHKLKNLYNIFKKIKYTKMKIDKNFPAITKAMKFGSPPHGGIAIGIERIVMIIKQKNNIRDIIAFPLDQYGKNDFIGIPRKL